MGGNASIVGFRCGGSNGLDLIRHQHHLPRANESAPLGSGR
jgi:hypothetical protein